MKSSLLNTLKGNQIKFSKAQRQVADYIAKYPLDTSFTTLEALSITIGTSTTTIMRFCVKLGYNGFSELQKDLQSLVRERIAPQKRLEANIRTIQNNPLLSQCAQKSIENISKTQSLITDEVCQKIIETILSAKQVYMFGARTSHTVSYYLYHGLVQILGNCQLVGSVSPVDELSTISDGDLIIVVSLPRYASSTIKMIKTVKTISNVKIIAITDSYQAPIAKYADIIIPCHYASLSFHNSMSSALFIADYIVTAVAIAKKEVSSNRLAVLETFFRELDFHID